MTNLEGLMRDSYNIKQKINALQQDLDAVNSQIATFTDSEEGAKTLRDGGYKATVTYKLNRRLNVKKWLEVKDGINLPDDYKIVVDKPSLDATAFKKLEKDHPEWLQYTAEFVTVSEAKIGVKVEKLEEEK